MHKPLLSLFFIILFLHTDSIRAQDKLNAKFGKIDAESFKVSSPVVDANTDAVVVFDIGRTEFEGNNKGWFTLVFRRQVRIKIINSKGIDAATFGIRLYKTSMGDKEMIEDMHGATYNQENGQITVTRLDNKSIFSEETNKNILTKKFTLPAVKEGSIIEYTYTVKSDFFVNLQPWEFQGSYPRLWSEYEVSIPEYFKYVFLAQGYQPYAINTNEHFEQNFRLSFASGGQAPERASFNGLVNRNRWVLKNVPALKTEPFTTTINNHISKIEFQLSEIQFPNQLTQPYMGSWKSVGEKYLKSENFGLPISRANGWLDDELKLITKGAGNETESARKIFSYVRDNFTSTGSGILLSGSHSLKDIFKNKSGSEGELNLLLIAMLRHEKIKAWPVLLSTRANGLAHPMYPLMDRYNYLICLVSIDSADYCLDASNARIGFGRLPEYCYNGTARMITEDPEPIDLSADKLEEGKVTSVIVFNNESGGVEGAVSSTLGYYSSLDVRNKIAKSGEQEFYKEINAKYPPDIKTENFSIDSLKSYDNPVTIKFDFKLNHGNETLLYVNPMFADGIKENIFKSAARYYPVEMPYLINNTYVLSMEVPKGYTVDEIPKSARVKFNENEGMFEYIITHKDGMINMRCRLVLVKANFDINDYNSLRDFFGLVVKKQSEQIVFKKQN